MGWDAEDQDKALAYLRHKALECPDCRTREEDWAEDKDYYIGDLYHCEGCARIAEERDNIPDGAKGVHVRLLPKEIALARIEQGQGLI